jgi:hypothetical protein
LKKQDKLPDNSVLGGWSSQGQYSFVARFWHEGNMLPAKLIVDFHSNTNHVSAIHDSSEIVSDYFQVIYVIFFFRILN